jgi:hypothetical protein
MISLRDLKFRDFNLPNIDNITSYMQCLSCQKISGGLTISRHAIDLNRYVRMYGGGLQLTPQGIPGHLVCGVKQTTGGFNPPTPRQFKHCLRVLSRQFLAM